jgi:hypothetical protein
VVVLEVVSLVVSVAASEEELARESMDPCQENDWGQGMALVAQQSGWFAVVERLLVFD